MSAARSVPLLICSIGNPGTTYANTLHSAGHYVVQRVAEHLDAEPFKKSKPYGNGLLTRASGPDGSDWTLWQSTSYMNESGKGVLKAYREWMQDRSEGQLVIVHDQLEHDLGRVSTITNPNASAKGHNGLKSIKSLIRDAPYARIGIGIGRPVSREPDDVAKYVLRKMTVTEKETMADSTGNVIAALERLATQP